MQLFRKGQFEPEDLFQAHIADMDTFAKGLKVAAKLIEDRFFENIIDDRYSSFKSGIGVDIVSGKATFRELEQYALGNHEIRNTSGKLEWIKAQLMNTYSLYNRRLPMKYVIGIDLGTGSVKALLCRGIEALCAVTSTSQRLLALSADWPSAYGLYRRGRHTSVGFFTENIR